MVRRGCQGSSFFYLSKLSGLLSFGVLDIFGVKGRMGKRTGKGFVDILFGK